MCLYHVLKYLIILHIHLNNLLQIQTRINNCDILISTPLCLLEFFQDHLITFSRLGEFVVDDGSAVMIKHKIEVNSIILILIKHSCVFMSIFKNSTVV